MQITIKIDDFVYLLFPDTIGKSQKVLIDKITDYYTFGEIKPLVSIENGWLNISLDINSINKNQQEFNHVTSLCEKGNYDIALPLISKLISSNPTNSEYHRVKGQILSDIGKTEEAIDSLIDALRWNPKNAWALVMMGNIFARDKNDVETALKYYNQALLVNPNDHITLNNIGANLMQQGDVKAANKFFTEALKSNDTYPNTHFALGMIAAMENDLQSAFYSTIRAIKTNNNRDILYQNSLLQSFEIAKKINNADDGRKLFRSFRKELESSGGKSIDIVEDSAIPTAAKIEFAENHNREKHIVKFNPKYPAFSHLVMHELVHLELVIEAKTDNLNELFISTHENRTNFIKTLDVHVKKLHKIGISEDAIAKYCNSLFDGLNRQIFNAPIDLFIEEKLFTEYPELRSYQYLSLYNLLQEGLKAVTDKKILDLSPKNIISISKIYNIVGALQFADLFGIDFIKDFNASPIELTQSKKFYDEFLEYKEDKQPGEEYELVQHWAEDLKLENYFELVNEQVYRNKRTNIETILDDIERDPFDQETFDPQKVKDMETFQKSQAELGLNMAVVMFMVDAFQYFKSMELPAIKQLAFEIAMQGTQGYHPEKEYRLSSVKGKLFSGYHILAYYYVSWSLAIPDMVSELKLPYEEEYKMAKALYQNKYERD